MRATSLFVVFLTALAGCDQFSKNLPSCDQGETIQLTESIVNNMPLAKAQGAIFVALKDIKEQGYNQNSGVRACQAVLVTTKGEDNFQYSISWKDKSTGNFAIEAQVVAQNDSSANEGELEFARDFEDQYKMAKRNGAAPVQICAQAGLVSMAYLQAKDEQNYAKWVKIEKAECLIAGIEK